MHSVVSLLCGVMVCLMMLPIGVVQAQTLDSELVVCMRQLACEPEIEVNQKIDALAVRVVQIVDSDLMVRLLTALESARVSARGGYIGRSLMILVSASRSVDREFTLSSNDVPVSTSLPVLDSFVEDTTISKQAASSTEMMDVSTTSGAILIEVPTTTIDKAVDILSE